MSASFSDPCGQQQRNTAAFTTYAEPRRHAGQTEIIGASGCKTLAKQVGSSEGPERSAGSPSAHRRSRQPYSSQRALRLREARA